MAGHLSTARTQVVVVGAGPVGLMLAGELRRGGATVVVLERLAEPTTESRASTLHARTMEVLDSRGLLRELGSPPRVPRGHFGGIPMDLTLPSSHPGQWKVPQTRIEELLGAWADSLGAEVRRAHRVLDVTVRSDHVEVHAEGPAGAVTLRALAVVGCDGEESLVRRLMPVDFAGQDATREMLRADVAGIDIPDRRFERREHGLAVASRRDDGVTRIMVHVFGSVARHRARAPGYPEVAEAWRRVTGEDVSAGTPLWVNAFHDASRQVSHYRRGRLLLAGDAAHQQMPIGGQALNLGLQDAVNLGWKLALHVRGKASEGLLDSYHTERHAVGARTLANIRAQALLLLGGPEVEPLRNVLGELMAHEETRAHLAGMISGLDIRYPHDATGPIGHRLAPTRLCDADGRYTTTGELLRTGKGLLIVPSPRPTEKPASLQAIARPWEDRVTVVRAQGAVPGGEAVLLRPDAHVAWAGRAGEGLEAALGRWFGPPADALPEVTHHTATAGTPAPRGRNVMSRFTGKTALVTGSSRGMGRATAIRLAAEGALVAVHYTQNQEAAKDVVTRIEKDGGRAFALRAELGTPGDVHELFLALEAGLRERTGATRLDILVNNAGVMGGSAPEEMTAEQFDRLFDVNTKAPFFLTKRALQNMPDGGRVINISSALTRCANPEEIVYAMSKGALEQMALHFAQHLGPRGITVNSVRPGITRNDNPLFDMPEAVEQMSRLSAFGRVGEPADVADVVAFLASEDARWVTGTVVDASGGTSLA
ncbi:SDR family oxidoreductase [Streptomyces sp. NPDC059740]|uniref:SDR family oxidoreductase n=1 Tax=Streptomyces sp. NPDC059740 TaxID=3346926 RepID=UPI00366649DE